MFLVTLDFLNGVVQNLNNLEMANSKKIQILLFF